MNDYLNNIPKHWVVTELGKVFFTASGGTPSTDVNEYWENGNVPWINSSKLKDCVISEPTTYITNLGLEKSAAKLFPKNTIVIALTGATTGRVGILDFECSTNQSVTGIFPNKFYHYKLLFYYLVKYRDELLKSCLGSAQPHINKKIVDEIHLPLPPLNEQKRIVEKLDLLLPKVKSAKERLERIPVLLKKFRQSVLAAACSGKLTEEWRKNNFNSQTSNEQKRKNIQSDIELPFEIDELPEGWEMKKIEDVSIRIFAGSDKPKDFSKEKNENYFYPIYSNGINNDLLGYAKYFDKRIIGETVTVSARGTIGYAKYRNEKYLPVVRLIVIQPNLDFIKAKYLEIYINAIKINVEGTAIPQLTVPDFSKFLLIAPPLPEQEEIIRRVEKLFAIADKVEEEYKKAIKRIEKLEQSILAKAFRGELAEPDPNDEPAEILLQKILKEKEKIEAQNKNKRNSRKKKIKKLD